MLKKIKVGSKTLRIKDCKGFSSATGLMFDPLDDKDGALIYANNIWTPFCKPLDLYFLDEQNRVISKESADPLTFDPKTWRVYVEPKASACLELRKGLPAIRPGTKIKFL